jgi:hypothetical protein
MVASNRRVRERLSELGYSAFDFTYYEADGGTHTEKSWGERFFLPMQTMYGA